MSIIAESASQIAAYGKALRDSVRGLWRGVITPDQFENIFFDAIRFYLVKAWNDGAAKCGIKPSELSDEELGRRTVMVFDQFLYVSGFTAAIWAGRRELGGKLGPLIDRTALWQNHYRQVEAMGEGMACADRKKVFVLGPTKEHCRSCAGLAGRVYRLSVWTANGALPPSGAFSCKGFR